MHRWVAYEPTRYEAENKNADRWLGVLEAALVGKEHIVLGRLTLADIFLAVTLRTGIFCPNQTLSFNLKSNLDFSSPQHPLIGYRLPVDPDPRAHCPVPQCCPLRPPPLQPCCHQAGLWPCRGSPGSAPLPPARCPVRTQSPGSKHRVFCANLSPLSSLDTFSMAASSLGNVGRRKL